MYLVNNFGRVVDVEETIGKQHIARGTMRTPESEELAAYLQHQQTRAVDNLPPEATVYYQTVPASPDGYGMSRDHLKRELFKQGITLTESFKNQKVGLLYNYPYSLASMRTDVKIIYTMFESDKIPADWVEYLELADEVLVPSTWCQEVFAKAGIKSTVVPLGFNSQSFFRVERKRAGDEPFTFLHYDSFNARKGFLEIFQAFNEEFGEDDNVRLILKTVQEHVAIPVLKAQYPKIDVKLGMMSEMELLNLLEQADCFVYPSRGEGFGITPLEAMATGIPAIVPNAHGISEYFDPTFMLECKVAGPTPALYNRFRGQDVGNMVMVDVEDLKKQMRKAYERQADVKGWGNMAAKYAQNYTYEKTATTLASIIQKWQKAKVTKHADGKVLRVEQV